MPGVTRLVRKPGLRTIVVALALAGSSLAPLPVAGQAQDAEARLKKVESEVRALQRKVFPNGDSQLYQPEIVPPNANGPAAPTSTSAVTDMLGRIDSIERQLSRLTAQTELNTNEISLLVARLDALEAAEKARVEAAKAAAAAVVSTEAAVPQPELSVAQPASATPAPRPATATPTPTPAPAATQPPRQAAATPAPAQRPAATPAPAATPSADRLAAVKAIVKPQTADPGDDEYTYGFRLWSAGFYPEARQQLQMFVDKNADHWRASYARNLLGRAFLDDGKLQEAVPVFINNYEADKNGARAPDSLLFLAETLIKLNDKRSCIALSWFSDGYPALQAGRLQDQYNALVRQVKCN